MLLHMIKIENMPRIVLILNGFIQIGPTPQQTIQLCNYILQPTVCVSRFHVIYVLHLCGVGSVYHYIHDIFGTKWHSVFFVSCYCIKLLNSKVDVF